MKTTLVLCLSVLVLPPLLLAEELPQKALKPASSRVLTGLYDMGSNYQNDIESHTEISNSGSTWLRENGMLIGTAPTEEYNQKKREERAKLGKNAHVKSMPIITFPVPSEFNKNTEFGYVLHLLVKSTGGEDYRKGSAITSITGGSHDATLFRFDSEGLSINVSSKKREISETLATDDSLKLEGGKWYEVLIESNRKMVSLTVRDTVTNQTVTLKGKHAELDRHNKRIYISGSNNQQTLAITGIDFSYYE